MTITDNTEQDAAHTAEPWGLDGFVIFNPASSLRKDARDFIGGQLAVVGGLGTKDKAEQSANARRICAAVNACKGIGTEALKRGIIAEMRHVLGELLTAACDLDAAIDGATDEFDAERSRLNTVIHTAQAVFDGGMELDLHELLAARHKIAAIWCIEDVQAVRPDLTDDQAWEVLQDAQRKHDAMMGISWDTLEILAEDLFGPAPETAEEE